MGKKYAASTGGFYDTVIHGDNIPADAVEITDEQHAALLAGQSSGKIISADASGKPILVDYVHVSTNEEIIASLTAQIQQRLDAFAKTRNYDGILSACTYATSTVTKFATEGQYCVQARDATWAAGYVIMEDVLSGARAVPDSIADIEADLPVLTWPA